MDLMEDYFKPETDTQIKHVIDSLNDTAKRIGKVLAEQQSGGSLAVAEGSGEARTVAGISNPGASLGEVNPTGGLVKQKTSPEESKAAAGLSASAAKSDAKIPSAGSGSPAKPDNGNTDGASEEELEKTRAAGAAKLKAEAEEMRARYKLFPPPEGLADERKAEKYKERQLRCFAADWLTQKLEKREFDTLNQSRRQWSNFVLR